MVELGAGERLWEVTKNSVDLGKVGDGGQRCWAYTQITSHPANDALS